MIFLFSLILSFVDTHAMSIYGPDNRSEIIYADPNIQNMGRSTPALIAHDNFSIQNGVVTILGPTLGEDNLLCPTERFKEQKTAASCSGVLVGDDLILTANHCYMDADTCTNSSWVFDYKLDQKITASDVFRCKEVAYSNEMTDLAVIRLDRKVSDRVIIPVKNNMMKVDELLTMLGYPSGVPLKVTDQGRVLIINEDGVLTNLDAFAGNSGSGVFDSDSLELVGILSTGAIDYVNTKGCTTARVQDEDQGVEKVIPVRDIGSVIKRLQNIIP